MWEQMDEQSMVRYVNELLSRRNKEYPQSPIMFGYVRGDYSSISDIRTLDLVGDSLADLRFLPRLTSLEELLLGPGRIENFQPVLRLRNLKNLSLADVSVDNLPTSSPVLSCPRIVLGRVSGPGRFQLMKLLEASTCIISDMRVSTDFDIAVSAKTENLTIQNIAGLRTLSFLPSDNRIRYLNVLGCNDLTSLEGISRVRKAEEVQLRALPVLEKLQGLGTLESLRNLEIYSESLMDLSELGKLSDLQCLGLDHWGSRTINISGTLPKVSALDVGREVKDFEFLRSFPNLTFFAYGKYTGQTGVRCPPIEPIQKLTGLKGLIIRRISNPQKINLKVLWGMKNLRVVEAPEGVSGYNKTKWKTGLDGTEGGNCIIEDTGIGLEGGLR